MKHNGLFDVDELISAYDMIRTNFPNQIPTLKLFLKLAPAHTPNFITSNDPDPQTIHINTNVTKDRLAKSDSHLIRGIEVDPNSLINETNLEHNSNHSIHSTHSAPPLRGDLTDSRILLMNELDDEMINKSNNLNTNTSTIINHSLPLLRTPPPSPPSSTPHSRSNSTVDSDLDVIRSHLHHAIDSHYPNTNGNKDIPLLRTPPGPLSRSNSSDSIHQEELSSDHESSLKIQDTWPRSPIKNSIELQIENSDSFKDLQLGTPTNIPKDSIHPLQLHEHSLLESERDSQLDSNILDKSLKNGNVNNKTKLIYNLNEDIHQDNEITQSSDKNKMLFGEDSVGSFQNIAWKKGQLLGKGGFGNVYLGLNSLTGELFAVKQLDLVIYENADQQTRRKLATYQKELDLMRTLKHENIVRYLGTQITHDSLYIFLEYVPGGSIHSLLTKFGPFSEIMIKLYTKQILKGLHYLHSNGIIHRDIKGANILVDTNGICKLADFGCAKVYADLAAHTSVHSVLGY